MDGASLSTDSIANRLPYQNDSHRCTWSSSGEADSSEQISYHEKGTCSGRFVPLRCGRMEELHRFSRRNGKRGKPWEVPFTRCVRRASHRVSYQCRIVLRARRRFHRDKNMIVSSRESERLVSITRCIFHVICWSFIHAKNTPDEQGDLCCRHECTHEEFSGILEKTIQNGRKSMAVNRQGVG